MFKKILSLFLIWRILLFLPLFLSNIFLQSRLGFDYTSFSYWSKISHFLAFPWANFDGIYYLYIAGSGYTVDNAGFFPLYPMLVKFFSLNAKAFSLEQFLVSLVLSSAFFFSGLIYFNKLLKLDYKKNVSISVILAMLMFPTSFFFATIYSESLFFLLLILSFYFARRGNWLLSSIFAALLTSTRIVGIAIIPALIFEFYLQNKTLFKRKFLSLFIAPLGILSYSLFNFLEWGNPLQFLKAQGALQNNRSVDEIILFPQTVFRYIKILFANLQTHEWWIALLELSSFIFASILLYIAWKKRVRISYLVFALVAFLIPTQTGTFSGLPRYVLILFPIFIALSLIKSKYIKLVYAIVSIILLAILFSLFSKGYFIA